MLCLVLFGAVTAPPTAPVLKMLPALPKRLTPTPPPSCPTGVPLAAPRILIPAAAAAAAARAA